MKQGNKIRKVVLLDPDVHAQIEAYFKEQGIKFNLSEAVRDVELGLLNSLIKQREIAELGVTAPLLKAKATAGLIIADAFHNLFDDLKGMEK